MVGKITVIMKKEHRKIRGYLNDFLKKGEKNFWIIFKKNVKKHFEIEETAIFILVGKSVENELDEILSLRKQHKEILRYMKTIEKSFHKKQEDLVRKLTNLITRHATYEEKTFYPKIDQMLEEWQKEEIIENIRKMLN